MKNPLEEMFDIESGSTPTLQTVQLSQTKLDGITTNSLIDPSTGEIIERKTDKVSIEEYDKEERIEDIQVDTNLHEINTAAMNAFYAQHAMSQQVDPKFSARNSEVAAQFLNIALATVNSRVDAKYKRQKIRIAKKMDGSGGNSVQNNVIFADRNSLMKSLFKQDFEKPFVEQLRSEIMPDKT